MYPRRTYQRSLTRTICGVAIQSEAGTGYTPHQVCARPVGHLGEHGHDQAVADDCNRYSRMLVVTAEEWAQARDLILDRFHRTLELDCMAHGYPLPPDGTTPQISGARVNSEGSRCALGQLMPRVECDPADPRVVEIEIRLNWTG